METFRALNYFSSPAFLRADLKAGVLRSRGGTRLVGINEDFLRGFVIACEHETGPATILILRRCGRRFGERLARRCEHELSSYLGRGLRDCSMAEFDLLVQDLWRGCGLGDISIGWPSGQHGFLPVKLRNSPMQDIGAKGHVADDMFCGVIEGFIEHFAASSLRCVQTGDERLGNKEGTTFILTGPELQPRLAELLERKNSHAEITARLGGE
jgi:hypothetical protein